MFCSSNWGAKTKIQLWDLVWCSKKNVIKKKATVSLILGSVKPFLCWVVIYSRNDTTKFTVRNSGRCRPLNFFSSRWIVLLCLYQQGMIIALFCRSLLVACHPNQAVMETVSRFKSKRISKVLFMYTPLPFVLPTQCVAGRVSMHSGNMDWAIM